MTPKSVQRPIYTRISFWLIFWSFFIGLQLGKRVEGCQKVHGKGSLRLMSPGWNLLIPSWGSKFRKGYKSSENGKMHGVYVGPRTNLQNLGPIMPHSSKFNEPHCWFWTLCNEHAQQGWYFVEDFGQFYSILLWQRFKWSGQCAA